MLGGLVREACVFDNVVISALMLALASLKRLAAGGSMRFVSLIVLAGLFFSACGADRPDDESAKRAVQAQISGPLADKLLLNVAAQNGYKDVVESLLARGVDINAKGDDGTPLYWAIASKQPAMALYLIEKGADVNREKSGGWVPLNVAESELDRQDPLTKDVIAALVERGARKK